MKEDLSTGHRLAYEGAMSTLPLFGKGSGSREPPRVLRVSQLNRYVRATLEERWGDVWVEGELRDVTFPASGHVYFTLCDEAEPAQVRGVMFRSDAQRSRAKLANGARVKMRGSLSLFEPRGSYQLIARVAVPHGLGERDLLLEALRKKLEAEGLLAAERKRPLPLLPRCIGVVTSMSGAALHDIARVAHGRCPVRIVIAPCAVQGVDAPLSIALALEKIQRVPELDVVIVGRGGGSAEDLIAFNDELVARAIANCRVPVVSAVGHEVDVSIADLVADVRAATPSNAAELCVPDRAALIARLQAEQRHLERGLEVRLSRARLRLSRLMQRVQDPRSLLNALDRRMIAARRDLTDALDTRLRTDKGRLAALMERLARRDPRIAHARHRAHLLALDARLRSAGRTIGRERGQLLSTHAARLHALSPLAVLGRGYAIALHEPTGRALISAADAKPGDALRVRLHGGEIHARVESVRVPEPDKDMEPA
jgi:exodeoxyribonuclease VII large subunit